MRRKKVLFAYDDLDQDGTLVLGSQWATIEVDDVYLVDGIEYRWRPRIWGGTLGIFQGGRSGYPTGVWLNDKLKLPQRPLGYYTESDIWPGSKGSRKGGRLVFGKQCEVYFTPKHYEEFIGLR